MDTDGVDYQRLFAKQDPMNLRILTALRMNATFPYVLPNVWLPTNPVIDVMDAGLRDNYGQESTVRFIHVFKDWIKKNTRGVVILQIRDRKTGGWDNPYKSEEFSELFTKPLLLLQYNWYKMQEYNQNDLLSLSQSIMGENLYKISFQYVPKKEDAGAALNFHLTKREKYNIASALDNENNTTAFRQFVQLANTDSTRAAIAKKPYASF